MLNKERKIRAYYDLALRSILRLWEFITKVLGLRFYFYSKNLYRVEVFEILPDPF